MPDIDFGQMSEALNNKTDRDLRNVDTTAKADAVIDYQEPTAENGYTWYRKYKSGWVEQGGYYSGNITAGNNATINLIMPFANTYYNISVTGEQNSNNWAYAVIKDSEITTSSFKVFVGAGNSSDKVKGVYWKACGFAQ